MEKQVIILRKDIALPLGKACAQAAHASLEASLRTDIDAWRRDGQTKIVLHAPLQELRELHGEARETGLPTALIRDAGKTVTTEGTITALGIGPAEEAKIDKVTGHLDAV